MRQRANLTQRDLASRVRRLQPWVHKSEIGERRVDVGEFLEWCRACGVDPQEAFRQVIRLTPGVTQTRDTGTIRKKR